MPLPLDWFKYCRISLWIKFSCSTEESYFGVDWPNVGLVLYDSNSSICQQDMLPVALILLWHEAFSIRPTDWFLVQHVTRVYLHYLPAAMPLAPLKIQSENHSNILTSVIAFLALSSALFASLLTSSISVWSCDISVSSFFLVLERLVFYEGERERHWVSYT